MRSDLIRITGEETDLKRALVQAEKTAEYNELSEKNAMILRLLTEEVMAMVRAITGGVDGEFEIEKENGTYFLRLRVNTLLDSAKKQQLLSASTSGKNEATRGFMGKIRSFFESAGAVPMFSSGIVGGPPEMYGSYVWSMEEYKGCLKQYREEKRSGAQEEWDELEKSVVGHLADDVKVSIMGHHVEMTIIRKLD